MLRGRKFLSIFILGIMSFLLLLSVSIPVSFNTKAHVPYTLGKTMEQFTNESQLEKWFLNKAKNDIRLVNATPGIAVLNFARGGIKRDYRFLITRDTKKNNSCIVTMSVDNTLWKRMIDPDPIDDIVIKSLKNLETVTNNTALYYGFPIYKSIVTDSEYLYISAVIDTLKKADGTERLFDSLFRYARVNKINNSGKRIFSSQPVSPYELRIFAGIVINSKSKINPASGITVKKMHPGKPLLIADYHGRYKDISSAYKALEQYKRDYQLAGMEIPFEEFLTAGNSYQPEDSVMVKVCYPIY